MTRVASVMVMLMVGCGTPDEVSVPFAGSWFDGFDQEHVIDDQSWSIGADSFEIQSVDIEMQRIIALNGESNAYNPGLFSAFDWVEVDGVTWYCQSAFDAADADTAAAADPADASDPSISGCGGSFPWSRLYVPLDIRGNYTDEFGSSHSIREWNWTNGESQFSVVDFVNEEGFVIAQNAETNEYFPGLWSRFEWTTTADGVYYCQVAYDAADEAAARGAESADATDPAAGGCSGFAWTKLGNPE